MRIAIIDADLIGRKKHRFPNLACMKLSSYHKSLGDSVTLLTSYNNIDYDKIYLSKVFTDTEVPEHILSLKNLAYGGTGFFYDKAPDLPPEIEHAFPDYHLYDDWVQQKLENGGKRNDYVYYLDYSIGFLTRGCFRKCEFCVNKKYDHCVSHSPLSEFLDDSRPKICFLDDNFFACPQWKEIIAEVQASEKRFQFKQGLDERLLTDEKIHAIMSWNYDKDLIFAFDDIADKTIIENKLARIRELYPTTKKHFKFYVLCGFDRAGKYNDSFYKQDIANTFERISILRKYDVMPYIMRYEKAYDCRFKGVYSSIAQYCNQPNIFKKFSYREFCRCKGMSSKYNIYKRDYKAYLRDNNKKGAAWRYMEEFEREAREIADKYYDER